MIDITNILTFSTGGILGFLVGHYIDHLLARSRNWETIQITEFNKGAATFRAAFVNELFALRKNAQTGEQFLHSIITDEIFIAHEKAKILFEPFLTDNDLASFNTTWENYKNSFYDYIEQESPNYHPAKDSDKIGLSAYYLKNIEALLNYAKPKINR